LRYSDQSTLLLAGEWALITNPKRQPASEGKKCKKAAKVNEDAAKDKQEGVATRGTGSPKKVAKVEGQGKMPTTGRGSPKKKKEAGSPKKKNLKEAKKADYGNLFE
jgi:hypothetical protein